MKPVDFKAANINVDGVMPLNVSNGIILSRWKVETLRERISLLWHGTLWLAVRGDHMPSILISGDQDFEIVNN